MQMEGITITLLLLLFLSLLIYCLQILYLHRMYLKTFLLILEEFCTMHLNYIHPVHTQFPLAAPRPTLTSLGPLNFMASFFPLFI